MSVLHAVRGGVQRLGLDVQRFPRSAPLFQVVRLMDRRGVTCVIDVGANVGQYASELRRLGYRTSILCERSSRCSSSGARRIDPGRASNSP